MKKILIIAVILFVIGCGTRVNYVYKNDKLISEVEKIKYPTFGITIIGNAMPNLYSIVKTDIYKYYERPLELIYIPEEFVSLKNMTIDIDGYKKNNYPQIELLLVISLSEPKIERIYDKITEIEEYYEKGKKKTKNVDYEIYKTICSVKCDIFLYDIVSRELIAKSSEKYEKSEEYKQADLFPDYTLFGQIEDNLDLVEFISSRSGPSSTSLSEYPAITNIEAERMNNYFFTFLDKLDKK